MQLRYYWEGEDLVVRQVSQHTGGQTCCSLLKKEHQNLLSYKSAVHGSFQQLQPNLIPQPLSNDWCLSEKYCS